MSASPSDPDPHRLDVAAFAAVRGELAGEWPATRLRRLAAATLEEVADAPRPPVAWRAAGERRVLPGAGTQPSLALLADTEVMLECQRCLQPMNLPLHAERRIFFVAG